MKLLMSYLTNHRNVPSTIYEESVKHDDQSLKIAQLNLDKMLKNEILTRLNV